MKAVTMKDFNTASHTYQVMNDQNKKVEEVIKIEKIFPTKKDMQAELTIGKFIAPEDYTELKIVNPAYDPEQEILFENYQQKLKDASLLQKDSIEILSDENLLDLIDEELGKLIVNEEDARITLFIIALGGSLTINCKGTSMNLYVNDSSGIGKDHLVNSVLNFLPKENIYKRKRISATAFTYYFDKKILDSKIFYGEDLSNSIFNGEVFKVVSSANPGEESISTITVKQVAKDLTFTGKPVMIVTSASANPNPELLRRYPILSLDSSEEQSKAIVRLQAKQAMKASVLEFNKKLMESIKCLVRKKVKIPFAGQLVNVLDTSNVIIRTQFQRLLDYIMFSAVIHQYNRDTNEAGEVIANHIDYGTAAKMFEAVTSNNKTIPLPLNQKRIIKVFKKLEKEKFYSVLELEKQISFITDRQLRRELDKLAELQFLTKDIEDRAESRKSVIVFKFKDVVDLKLPKWDEIKNNQNMSS